MCILPFPNLSRSFVVPVCHCHRDVCALIIFMFGTGAEKKRDSDMRRTINRFAATIPTDKHTPTHPHQCNNFWKAIFLRKFYCVHFSFHFGTWRFQYLNAFCYMPAQQNNFFFVFVCILTITHTAHHFVQISMFHHFNWMYGR